MITKILKLLKFLPYYLEVFAKKLGGRGIMNPNNNGEFKVLEKIVKNSESNEVCFFDGGANYGDHSIIFLSFCELYKKQPLYNEVNTWLKKKNFKYVKKFNTSFDNNNKIIQADFFFKKLS